MAHTLSQSTYSTIVYVAYPRVTQWYTAHAYTLSQSTYSTIVYMAYPLVTQWCTAPGCIHPLPQYLQHHSIRGIPTGYPMVYRACIHPLPQYLQHHSILGIPTGHPMVYRARMHAPSPIVPIAPQYTWHTHGSPNGIPHQDAYTLSQSTYCTIVYMAYPQVTQWYTAYTYNTMAYNYACHPWVTQRCTCT